LKVKLWMIILIVFTLTVLAAGAYVTNGLIFKPDICVKALIDDTYQSIREEYPLWGKDTYKMFCDGKFAISRVAEDYDFSSADGTLNFLWVTHYYYTEEYIYLVVNNKEFICVDVSSQAVIRHNSIDSFDDEHQKIFLEKKFVVLPDRTKQRNVWDILFG